MAEFAPLVEMTDFGSALKVADKLTAVGERVADPLPAFELIAAEMFTAERALFSSQGRRGGGSWKPLKEDTVKRKGHATILVNSGELRASLTEPGHPNNILNFTHNSIEFGTSDDVAIIQNDGTSRGIPPRPLLKFYSRDYELWNRILMRYLMEPLD